MFKYEIVKANPPISSSDFVLRTNTENGEVSSIPMVETNADYRKLIDITIKGVINENLNHIQNFGIIAGDTEGRIKQIKSYLGF
jgi:hypothetical protein